MGTDFSKTEDIGFPGGGLSFKACSRMGLEETRIKSNGAEGDLRTGSLEGARNEPHCHRFFSSSFNKIP